MESKKYFSGCCYTSRICLYRYDGYPYRQTIAEIYFFAGRDPALGNTHLLCYGPANLQCLFTFVRCAIRSIQILLEL